MQKFSDEELQNLENSMLEETLQVIHDDEQNKVEISLVLIINRKY